MHITIEEWLMNKDAKILLPGGAGLVGQNLIILLKEKGYTNITVIDKREHNLNILKSMHPEVVTQHADLAQKGSWCELFKDAQAVVLLQAHIGSNNYDEFVADNITSTQVILELIKDYHIPSLVHISSSVVTSIADDFYTNTKKEQERIVLESGIACPILRPTLMFGWFDRKHLGWLSRFMKKVKIFPIPGNGRFMRQPLYVGDFCNIIISCMEQKVEAKIYNITGLEQIDYIDIIRKIKEVTKAKTFLLKIPYSLFYFLIWIWGLFDKKPPFTTQQLEALVAKDEFEVIDWPGIFNVTPTPFADAIEKTFTDSVYSEIVLEF